MAPYTNVTGGENIMLEATERQVAGSSGASMDSFAGKTFFAEAESVLESRTDVIAIGGGKGGIGKSILAANLGVHLASTGRKAI